MSVHQTSKAATALPLEIQQQVFAYLDSRSFYSAQKVCRYWRYACRASDPLKRQLRKMPVFMPPAEKAPLDPALMQNIFDEAARSLMLGVSTERAHDTPGSMSRASKAGFSLTPRVVATPDGNVIVTLNGRLISVYDVVGEQASLRTQRMINDLKETVGSGPWLKVNCNTSSELALSSDGSLLAIAQERTIQIYDLKDEPHSFTINEYVGSATGHYICGLDFEQNDHVLRVRLSGKGTVVYLGTPAGSDCSDVPAGIEHWKGKSGLRHVFVDSSLLSVQAEKSDETSRTSRISGVQILHDFEQGYLFAGQHHGGGDSSFCESRPCDFLVARSGSANLFTCRHVRPRSNHGRYRSRNSSATDCHHPCPLGELPKQLEVYARCLLRRWPRTVGEHALSSRASSTIRCFISGQV